MKWTNAKVNKLTKTDCIALIEQAEGTRYIFTNASLQELKNKVISLINLGLI